MEPDEVDFRIETENVSFLANCFDNSFALQNSLDCVKDYVACSRNETPISKSVSSQKKYLNSANKRYSCDFNLSNNEIVTQLRDNTQVFKKKLYNWGLPSEITLKYEEKGIIEMFDWQVQCLANSKVLLDCCNLVYSAPTSAGKTLIAEILTIKTILERQKKVIMILPFISIVREKMFYLQDILSSSGVRVEGFMGSQNPPGGLQPVHLAICTMEKANSLINKLIDEGNISELGAIIVDELHLLGDPHRGYILELLLTKIKYLSSKLDNIKIQIIGMSATLPNLEVLSRWLDAELFITEFRPIPLDEYCLVGTKYYNKSGKYVSTLNGSLVEGDCVLSLCLETIKEGCSILIFCMTKNRCESLAQNISSSFYKLGCTKNDIGMFLRNQLKSEKITEALEQLQNCPVGLDHVLKSIISFGVAYHHAGLTFDERDIIEGAFKSGAIRVLIATSTLSSGVNLPARKVIIRSPVFQRQPINILTYKQMVGRAGRMGKDCKGESILVCTAAEEKIGFGLLMGKLDPVESCIDSEDKFMRAILEMIASQSLCTKSELELYSKCTLLFNQEQNSSQNLLLDNTLKQLIHFELVRIQIDNKNINYVATSLGKACLASSMTPNDGISLFCELQKARQCLVLETELHLVYLVTPYSVSNQWNDIDWLHLLNLWESLTSAMKKVGELVGVQESFIIRSLRGINKSNNSQNKLNIHKRFYTALALQDLVNEKPLSDVANKFQCARGFLQGLQQSSATFAGMVTAFCHQLGWKNMELLISQFQDRLHFGIHSELLELMKLTSLNGIRARCLFNAGFETIASIATGNVNIIENVLHKAVPFQSEKERENDDEVDLRKRNKMKNIWITGCCGMTAREAAESLVSEARKYLQLEIGVLDIKWQNEESRIQGSEDIDKLKSNMQSFNKSSNTTPTLSIKKEIVPHVNSSNTAPDPIKHRNVSKSCNITESLTESNTKIKLSASENVCIQDNNCVINKSSILKQDSNMNLVLNKDEFIWDSLILTDTVFDSTKLVTKSISNSSPNISFEELPQNTASVPANFHTSSKDISLFSSEDCSSIFEDSLPLESVQANLIDIPKGIINDLDRDASFQNYNSSTILNAFKSTIIDIDEDEDIKLIYDDDHKIPEDIPANENIINKGNCERLQNNPVNIISPSPTKRHGETLKWDSQRTNKKTKYSDLTRDLVLRENIIVKCSQSENFNLKVVNNEIKCIILRGSDIVDNMLMLKTEREVSLLLDINSCHKLRTTLIGNKIFKGNKCSGSSENSLDGDIELRGLAFCIKNDKCLYLDLTSFDQSVFIMNSIFQHIFCTKEFILRMHFVKSNLLNIQKRFRENLQSTCVDISLTEWLLDSDEKISKIIDLTKKYCDIDILNTDIYINEDRSTYTSLNAAQNACLKAWCIWSVAERQKNFIDQYPFFHKMLAVETQISKILAKCEFYGITVDKDLASQLLVDVQNSQDTLQKKAFKICGYKFNFNSSKDVAKALGIYKGRKVRTNKNVLSAHYSPLASIVIYWRKLHSILTKTLYPLTEKATMYSADNRISPTYATYTSTGRISMHEPNLQNVPRTFSIPVTYLSLKELEPSRDVIEFNCRNIFKAAPDYVLVSADYCQLEMRILTHYCKDVALTKIMCSDADVFKSIAASWSGVPEEQVDDDLRQKAKQLCYGILYGMGNRALSQHLDVTEIEAAMFMDTFYKTYPAIRGFTEMVLGECKKNGYVETLMKRRRCLRDINSANASRRGSAERQAINTTIQGSAADIAKSAMCAVDVKTNDGDPPRLILQMHDELIYEVPRSKKDTFPLILKEIMEGTVHLNVPLPVKVRSGPTWGSMEEMKF